MGSMMWSVGSCVPPLQDAPRALQGERSERRQTDGESVADGSDHVPKGGSPACVVARGRLKRIHAEDVQPEVHVVPLLQWDGAHELVKGAQQVVKVAGPNMRDEHGRGSYGGHASVPEALCHRQPFEALHNGTTTTRLAPWQYDVAVHVGSREHRCEERRRLRDPPVGANIELRAQRRECSIWE